jgi:hypothetical protein
MEKPESMKVIDTKIPLTWLISTAFALLGAFSALLWSIAAQSNKIDQVLVQQAKTDARLDNRDVRIDVLANTFTGAVSTIQRIDDRQDLRLDNIERVVGLKIPIRK